MAPTHTISHRNVEGNRRVNYGYFTLASGDCSGTPSVVRGMTTGLRVVESLEVWQDSKAQLVSGIVLPRVTYPVYRSGDTTVYPAHDSHYVQTSSAKFLVSGNFTVEFTSTAGPILWKARGKV